MSTVKIKLVVNNTFCAWSNGLTQYTMIMGTMTNCFKHVLTSNYCNYDRCYVKVALVIWCNWNDQTDEISLQVLVMNIDGLQVIIYT